MAAAYSNSWVNSTAGSPLNVTTAPTAHNVLIGATVADSPALGNLTTLPSGFTADTNASTTTDGMTVASAHKNDATGSETTLGFAYAGANNLIGLVLAVSGADNTTPLDVAVVVASTDTATASPWAQAASATPVTDGCLLVAVFASDNSNGGALTSTSFATTSGTTGAWTNRQVINDGGGFRNIAIATATQTTHGAFTVTATGTHAADQASRAVILYCIRPASASGSTGTIATTNANDTSAASGTTTVKGTSATTNANDASSASGTTKILGTSATTNANDTSAASGTTKILGTSATTNANDTSNASGTVGGGSVTGTIATTNANDVSTASGTTKVIGTISVTNANDISAAFGTAGSPVTASQLGGRGRKATDDDWRQFAEYKDALRQARVELKKPKPSVARIERAVEVLVTPTFDVPDIETRIEDFRALEGIEDLAQKFQRVVHDFLLMLEDEDDVDLLLH